MKKIIPVISIFLAMLTLFSSTCIAMDNQVEITEKTPLLKEDGSLTKPGYCFTNMYEYDRSAIKAGKSRIKEWDFYQVSNDKYCFQMTIADISLGGAATVGIFDFETGEELSTMILDLFTFGSYDMSADAMSPHSYTFARRKFNLNVDVTETVRTIKFEGKKGKNNIKIDLTMKMLPEHESLVMAVPFTDTCDNKHFYYNQKVNCMETTGYVQFGDNYYEFKGKEDNSYCVLDWGRGVWPYHEVWWWGNGSTTLEDGSIFGFEIGWGFGDMSAASENTLFYNGKAHKIGILTLENEKEVTKNWTGTTWKITSDDGRFEMTMEPVFDHYTFLRFLFVGNICHQVFGKWNGYVILDDGTKLEIHDMYAFLERSDNMW